MDNEQKVTSLDLSKKLKDAGAKQESEWVWCYGLLFPMGEEDIPGVETYSAPDSDEMLEMLPKKLDKYVVLQLCWDRVDDPSCVERDWCAEYYDIPNSQYLHAVWGITPAEALGKLYLWLLKNGHCEKEKVE